MSGPWDQYKSAPADGPWSQYGKPKAAPAKTGPAAGFNADTSFGENLAAGAGKAVVDTGMGLFQLGAQALNAISPKIVSDEKVASIQADVDEAKVRDAELMASGGGLVGNIAGSIATMAVPGAAASRIPGAAKVTQALLAPKTMTGAAAVGAGMGATQPVASDDSRIGNMAIGAGGGVVGQAVPKVAGAIIAGNTRKPVQDLLDQGVKLTPGQIAGGAFQRVEEGATSIPILGDAIRASMQRANETFNTAALNRALEPIGDKATAVGREGIREVESKIGAFYSNLLPKLTVKLDPQFAVDMRTIKATAANLPPEQAAQFDKILNNEVLKKFASGRMSGEEMKRIESELGRLERGYRSDPAFANRELGAAIQDAQTALRDLVERGNPQFAGELQKANLGWANFVRVQRAASGVGSKEGVFTPAQLSSSVRANDHSLRHGGYARGGALMEDLSDTAKSVMRKEVPDSGTPYRAMLGIGGLGGAAALEPTAAAAILGGAAAYTQPVQSVITAIMARRPELLRNAGNAVSTSAPYLTLPSAAVAQALAQREGM